MRGVDGNADAIQAGQLSQPGDAKAFHMGQDTVQNLYGRNRVCRRSVLVFPLLPHVCQRG